MTPVDRVTVDGLAWWATRILPPLTVWWAVAAIRRRNRAAAQARAAAYLASVEAGLAGTDCEALAGMLRTNYQRPGRSS